MEHFELKSVLAATLPEAGESTEITAKVRRIPPGPTAKYNTAQDLLSWMSDHFKHFGNIYRACIYDTNVYVVSDPELADHVLRKNWQNYKKGLAIKRIGLLLGNGLMVSEGEFWKRQRRMIQPAFHQQAIDRLGDVMKAANVRLLEKWRHAAQQKRAVNLTRDLSLMVLEVVLISIFGDDYEQVAPHFTIVSNESARDLQFAEAFRPLGKIVSKIAAQRRSENRMCTDILGLLMEACDSEGRAMSDRQLICEIMTLIVAGHETTASTLNWIWYLLAHNVEAEEKLLRELSNVPRGESCEIRDLPKFPYTRQVIEEAMRLYPPGWLMTRKALRDDQLGDYFVPAGTEIYISPYLIQRNPAIWESPDRFNPDRFEANQSRHRHNLAMLPFSAGPRKCIGEYLARIEMQIHLITIAKQLRLSCTDRNRFELEAGVNLRNKYDFTMVPEVRC